MFKVRIKPKTANVIRLLNTSIWVRTKRGVGYGVGHGVGHGVSHGLPVVNFIKKSQTNMFGPEYRQIPILIPGTIFYYR